MEKETVKEVATDLLNTLKTEKLVLDWRKRQQTRAALGKPAPLPMMMVV
jgi:type I restriction enzyme, R subunit